MPATIEGQDAILLKLSRLAAKARSDARTKLVVGYSASYAVHVHEDLEAFHPNGQAKFLEQPAREYRDYLFHVVGEAMKKGQSLGSALALAGIQLLRLSRQLVPVKTGFLRDSGFTRVDKR